MALPAHLTADRMMRLALTSFSTNPALRRCTSHSIISSIVVASQLGLEPGIAGQGYLIPYKEVCTFVPGWQGLVGLLNNTGRATAWTGCVYEGDEWEFQLGSQPRCRHVPGDNFGDTDKLTWVYACGKVNGSEQPVIEAWPISRVLKHRDRYNKVGKKHYSFENLEMYARKVVLLQVLKYMPRSIELNNAIVAANAAETGAAARVEDGIVVEVPTETTTDKETSSDEAEEAAAGLAPVQQTAASAAAPPSQSSAAGGAAPKVQLTPQGDLEKFVLHAGYTFDEFRKWGSETGVLEDAESLACFGDLPSPIATRLLRAKAGLLTGLKAGTGREPRTLVTE
jgi:recombination protein RecT